MSQLDLFARLSPPAPSIHTPDPENIRQRLTRILDELRAAAAMPWDGSRERMYRNIFPQMTNWLPADEAQILRSAFAAELNRLANAA